MKDIPDWYKGLARMDISFVGEHPRKTYHTYTLYTELHGEGELADAQREDAMENEPSADIEARIDGISDRAVSMIQVWLGLPEQHRKITRQEIIDLLHNYPNGLFG